VPWLVEMVWDMIRGNYENQQRLTVALNVARAIVQNPNLECEAYLFSFLAIASTLSMAVPLGDDPLDELCALRDSAADFMGMVVQRYRDKYPDLEARLAEHLVSVVLDEREAWASRYGALADLMMIDSGYVRSMVVGRLGEIMEKVRPVMLVKRPGVRMQAAHFVGAIERLCGICFNVDTAGGGVTPETVAMYDHAVREFGCEFLTYGSRS